MPFALTTVSDQIFFIFASLICCGYIFSGQRKHSKGKATGSNDAETFDVEILWPDSVKTLQIQELDLLK